MYLAASISLDGFFATKYPDYPKFRTQITIKNLAEVIRAGFDRFALFQAPDQRFSCVLCTVTEPMPRFSMV